MSIDHVAATIRVMLPPRMAGRRHSTSPLPSFMSMQLHTLVICTQRYWQTWRLDGRDSKGGTFSSPPALTSMALRSNKQQRNMPHHQRIIVTRFLHSSRICLTRVEFHTMSSSVQQTQGIMQLLTSSGRRYRDEVTSTKAAMRDGILCQTKLS